MNRKWISLVCSLCLASTIAACDDEDETGPEKPQMTIVSSMEAPIVNPWGIAWDGGAFFITSYSTAQIYKINTEGTVLATFGAPGTLPHGLTFSSDYLWNVDYDTKTLYRIFGDWQYASEIPIPLGYPTGLTNTGYTYFWIGDQDTDILYESSHDGLTGTQIAFPWGGVSGLAFDGTRFWVSTWPENTIAAVSQSGDLIALFDAPGECAAGLEWAMGHLWMVDDCAKQIFEFEITGLE